MSHHSRSHAGSSAFQDLFLDPLKADLDRAKIVSTYGSPGHRALEASAREIHGLRLEREINKRTGEGK